MDATPHLNDTPENRKLLSVPPTGPRELEALRDALFRAKVDFDYLANYGLPDEDADLCYRCMRDSAKHAAERVAAAMRSERGETA